MPAGVCLVPGCSDPVQRDQLMCRRHWFRVPEGLRLEVWRTYRTAPGSAAHRRAIRQAIGTLKPKRPAATTDLNVLAAEETASAPCPYPDHRPTDWMAPGGLTCGVCHPDPSKPIVATAPNLGWKPWPGWPALPDQAGAK